MEIKIDETYHVASGCCPWYADEVSRKIICSSFLHSILRIKDNNNSPHGKFHRFSFSFSSKFPDLNFAPYVRYIYSCSETRTWQKQLAWVTCAWGGSSWRSSRLNIGSTDCSSALFHSSLAWFISHDFWRVIEIVSKTEESIDLRLDVSSLNSRCCCCKQQKWYLAGWTAPTTIVNFP